VSDGVITIGGYVTHDHHVGADIDPTRPTPPGRVSPGSSCRNILVAGGPARPNAGANTSTPSCTYFAPGVRGRTPPQAGGTPTYTTSL
jgi:hypothetical protein